MNSMPCCTCKTQDALTVLAEQRVSRSFEDEFLASKVRQVELVACEQTLNTIVNASINLNYCKSNA